MKTFMLRAAQGEIQITRIGDVDAPLPSGANLSLDNGKMVIGHSETGHHHVLERPARVVEVTGGDGMRLLYALLEQPNALIHERDHDTHETISLSPGVYEFRITREFDAYAQIARQQMD